MTKKQTEDLEKEARQRLTTSPLSLRETPDTPLSVREFLSHKRKPHFLFPPVENEQEVEFFPAGAGAPE